MTNRNPQCVYVAATAGEAEVVANWLGHQGITARVMDPASLGGLLRLSFFSTTGTSQQGVQVWALEESDFERARELLAEHTFQADAKPKPAQPVTATCEDCGRASTYPGHKSGTVQDCPHCGAYLDVPGEDEFDWSEAEPEP